MLVNYHNPFVGVQLTSQEEGMSFMVTAHDETSGRGGRGRGRGRGGRGRGRGGHNRYPNNGSGNQAGTVAGDMDENHRAEVDAQQELIGQEPYHSDVDDLIVEPVEESYLQCTSIGHEFFTSSSSHNRLNTILLDSGSSGNIISNH